MGQASLLPLNDMNVSHTSPKMPFFKSSSSKCCNLPTKMRVTKSGRSLAILPSFSALTISSHLGLQVMVMNKIRFAILAYNGHGILVQLSHVSMATNE
jgi:hypothetical protein